MIDVLDNIINLYFPFDISFRTLKSSYTNVCLCLRIGIYRDSADCNQTVEFDDLEIIGYRP